MAGQLCCVNRIWWKGLHARSSAQRVPGQTADCRSREPVLVTGTQAPGTCGYLGKDRGWADGELEPDQTSAHSSLSYRRGLPGHEAAGGEIGGRDLRSMEEAKGWEKTEIRLPHDGNLLPPAHPTPSPVSHTDPNSSHRH